MGTCRTLNYLNRCDIITNNQFGFRKNHSTSQPLTHFLNDIAKALIKKKHTIAIFCDLRKAFDCCNHSILIRKLEKYGFTNSALQWYKSYLTDRKQFVNINDTCSSLLDINIGVPQGSILGPLLFLLYVNDLPNCTKLCSLLFADDTTVWAGDNNVEDLMTLANNEFRNLVTYFRANKLAIHPDKTKFMIITMNNTIKNANFNLVCNFNNELQNDPSLIHNIAQVKHSDDVPAVKFLVYI
jgi:hypothetical protein